MQRLFRAALFLATFVMVLLAVTQVAGRVAFAFLDDAEARVNAAFAETKIRVHGLEGAWRYLNPGVKVREVELPAGTLRDVTLELDVLESARRGSWVLSRGYVLDGELTVEWADGRWQLKGMPPAGEPPLDVLELLWQSDQLHAQLDVILERETQKEALSVSARAANRGGSHGVALLVANADCASCVLEVAVDVRDEVPFVRERSRRTRVTANQFSLPLAAVTGQMNTSGRIADASVVWRDESDVGGGEVRVSFDDVALPGSEVARLDVQLQAVSDGATVQIASKRLALSHAHGSTQLDGVLAEATTDGVRVYVPSLDITGIAAWVAEGTRGVERVGRWMAALQLEGIAEDVHVALARADVGWHLEYGAQVSDLAMQAYKGAPVVSNGRASLFGNGRHIAARVDSPAVFLHLPEVFAEGWQLTAATGQLEAWMAPGNLSITGRNLSTALAGTQINGSFALAQPRARYDKRLALLIRADRADLAIGRQVIPYKLSAELLRWLQNAPKAGQFSDVGFAYQGQLHIRRGEPGRRLALRGQVDGGRVKFHESWPEVSDVSGLLTVSGSLVAVEAVRGTSLGVDLAGSEVTVLDNGDRVDVRLNARGDGGQALRFVRSSPLQLNLPFVTPEWQASGGVRLTGRVQVPLKRQVERQPAVDLRAKLTDLALSMPEYRTELDQLEGELSFQLPHALSADRLTGRYWGEPMRASIRHDAEHVRFDMRGRIKDTDTFRVVGMEDPGLFRGAYEFTAELAIGVSEEATTQLIVSTDLEGLAIDAPSGLGKTAEQKIATHIDVQFLAPELRATFAYGDAQGWLDIDEAPRRGAIGLAQTPPELAEGNDVVLVAGQLPVLRVEEWTGRGEGIGLPFDWQLKDVEVAHLTVSDFAVADVVLNGSKGTEGLAFDVSAQDLAGHVVLPDEGPMDLNLDVLRVPAGDTEEVADAAETDDPFPAELVRTLPEAHVLLEQVYLGDEDFGRWEFDLRRLDDTQVVFESLSASVKGVNIDAPEGVLWNGQTSQFTGAIGMADLADVLPLWGYAPTLSSERAAIAADVSWPGSPLNVALLGLSGSARFEAEEGRFLDVDAAGGAMRIMSLLNFSAIVRRLNLNFSDVVGKGLSFEEVQADVRMQTGRLTFTEPMHVVSTSSDFRIGGTVDLVSGVLDNEMVVTLPVTKGLPWYGAYVALANPLAGLGVLVGERLLRKPLQQFSSAKYAVRGTLDEPDVRFVELFSTRMSDPVPAVEPVEEDSG